MAKLVDNINRINFGFSIALKIQYTLCTETKTMKQFKLL